MAKWIDQTKQKLFDIIKQAKESENLKLRVAFVGYVIHSSWTGLAISLHRGVCTYDTLQNLRNWKFAKVYS